MAKALGSGVVQGTMAVGSGVVQGTMAVGSGVVQGTMAVGSGVVQGSIVVGSGVVQGSKVVGTGVVQGTKAVGTGVVQGTLAAGRMTKDVTIAVGKGVYHASEVVGNAAVTGVSAAGEATVSAGRVVTNASVSAVMDTTKWVKEQSESFGYEDHDMYTILPGDTLEELASKNNVSAHDIIRINHLQRRLLIPGKQIIIPDETDCIEPHPDEILVAKAFIIEAENQESLEAFVKLTAAKFTATSNGLCILECEPCKLLKLSLDVAVDGVPDLLPANSLNLNDSSCNPLLPKIIQDEDQPQQLQQQCHIVELDLSSDLSDDRDKERRDEVSVILTLIHDISGDGEVIDGDEESTAISSKQFKFAFPQGDLSSLHSYLELWHPEKLETSQEFQKYLVLESSGLTNCDDSGPLVLDDSSILEERNMREIYRSLPHKVQNQAWSLSYSTRINGFSLQNLYRTLSEDKDSSLIVIQDNNGYVFGAYLTCTPKVSEAFIGTGKSWLFSFGKLVNARAPERENVDDDGDNTSARGSIDEPGMFVMHSNMLNVFHWSGINEYFFRGTIDNMIIGASGGKFGIFIDGDLHKGRIQDCDTFDRWAHQELDFTIRCLECWRFV
jgi:hypothetical protein